MGNFQGTIQSRDYIFYCLWLCLWRPFLVSSKLGDILLNSVKELFHV